MPIFAPVVASSIGNNNVNNVDNGIMLTGSSTFNDDRHNFGNDHRRDYDNTTKYKATDSFNTNSNNVHKHHNTQNANHGNGEFTNSTHPEPSPPTYNDNPPFPPNMGLDFSEMYRQMMEQFMSPQAFSQAPPPSESRRNDSPHTSEPMMSQPTPPTAGCDSGHPLMQQNQRPPRVSRNNPFRTPDTLEKNSPHTSSPMMSQPTPPTTGYDSGHPPMQQNQRPPNVSRNNPFRTPDTLAKN